MRRKTNRNIVKQYKRYLRKLNVLLTKDQRSPKIFWLRKRLRKLKGIIETRIRTYQLLTKRIVTATAIAAAVTAGIQAQEFELVLNEANPFYDVAVRAQSKPHFVDFDSDGDDDLFVTAYMYDLSDGIKETGLYYYVNDGGSFNLVVDKPFPDDLGITDLLPADAADGIMIMDFVDFDGDGDVDAFSSVYEGSGISYLENVDGTLSLNADANPFSEIAFMGDSLDDIDFNDFDLGDISGDGVMEAVIIENDSIKIFNQVDGKFVFSENMGKGEGASATLFDVDGDDDLDLIIGNKYGRIDIYENTDGMLNLMAEHELSNVVLEYSPKVAFTDVTGDGDLDAILGMDAGALSYLEKEEEGYEFVPYNQRDIHFFGTSFPSLEFADIDGDGDQDLLVGAVASLTKFIENTDEDGWQLNNAGNPFGLTSGLSLLFTDPNCGDIDGDGDIDCHFISNDDGTENYFENIDGSYMKQDSASNPIAEFTNVNNRYVTFEDFDGDGDLDVFIGNKYGELFYYENVEGVYTEKAEVADIIAYDDQFSMFFGDVNGDGDNDLVAISPFGDLDYYMKSAGTLTKMVGDDNPFKDLGQILASLDFADLDGDGDMDILGSDRHMRAVVFENLSIDSGVESELFSSETKVYPNPTSSMLRIDMPWSKGNADVLVYNNNGQFVKKLSTSSPLVEIDVRDLAAGNYHLKIVDGERLAIQKFAIIR